jgi:cyclophilin family peptidyl-prolyl cis-trans isomerase
MVGIPSFGDPLMILVMSLVTALAVVAQFQSQSAAQTANDGSAPAPATLATGLTPEFVYNGVNRPARITVTPPRSFGTVTLALMDFDGIALADPIEVHPGVIDLAEKLPAIWDIRRTAFLQMIDGATPVGSALVLQPMLSRMVPVTEIRPHPVTGNPHSRIVRWVDENALPPPATAQNEHSHSNQATGTKPLAPGSAGGATPASPNATSPPAPTAPPQPNPKSEPENPKSTERLFTGLRMYPERDVILHTTHGDIRLAMKPDEAANTVWNFLELARGGFYRDVQFHRIVPSSNNLPFVIQAGDPTDPPTGDGGPGYWLPIEDSNLPHDFGVISMARSDDPDSNGSQFFICLSREGTKRLDGQYCSFGYAVDGAPAIISIAQSPLANVKSGRPVEPPLIKHAELVASPPRVPGKGRPDSRITPESKPAEPKPTGRIPR